jgi:hypothetical protein
MDKNLEILSDDGPCTSHHVRREVGLYFSVSCVYYCVYGKLAKQ